METPFQDHLRSRLTPVHTGGMRSKWGRLRPKSMRIGFYRYFAKRLQYASSANWQVIVLIALWVRNQTWDFAIVIPSDFLVVHPIGARLRALSLRLPKKLNVWGDRSSNTVKIIDNANHYDSAEDSIPNMKVKSPMIEYIPVGKNGN